MDLVSLLGIVIVFGVLFWLIGSVIPMPQMFKTVATVILALILIACLIDGFRIGHIHLFVR